MDLKRIIANNIFILRNQHKLTQEDFAKKLNITRGHLSHIENGDNMPSAEFIKDVCSNFNVSADWLLDSHIILNKEIVFSDKDLTAILKFHNLNSKTQDAILNLMSELFEIDPKK